MTAAQRYVYCTPCGKRRYPKRADARTVARSCPNGDGWHIGHLPASVRQGASDRRKYSAAAIRRARAVS
jgi:hypothetical protein